MEIVKDHIMPNAEEILKNPFLNAAERKWSIQGFGMLRMYLPGDMRLNIWDSRYQYKPKPSMIHDHPWDFTSIVVCGQLFNWRFVEGPASEAGPKFYQRTIRPGVAPQHIGQDKLVTLFELSHDTIKAGESYYQEFDEIHESGYMDGTITVNIRNRGNRPDRARVFYPVGQEWISAEPRPATKQEVEDICNNALKLWF